MLFVLAAVDLHFIHSFIWRVTETNTKTISKQYQALFLTNYKVKWTDDGFKKYEQKAELLSKCETALLVIWIIY